MCGGLVERFRTFPNNDPGPGEKPAELCGKSVELCEEFRPIWGISSELATALILATVSSANLAAGLLLSVMVVTPSFLNATVRLRRDRRDLAPELRNG